MPDSRLRGKKPKTNHPWKRYPLPKSQSNVKKVKDPQDKVSTDVTAVDTLKTNEQVP